MLKNLKIVFTKEEKTLENLNKVLELLGDDSYGNISKKNFIGQEDCIGLNYDVEIKEYINFYNFETLNNTELLLMEFLEKYDSKEIKQVIDNPDVNAFVNREETVTDADRELKRDMENDSEPESKTMKELYESEPDKWDGCIIKASKESYDFLSKIPLKMSESAKQLINNPLGYYEIRDGIALCMTTTCIDKPNEVFIKDGELVKQKPKTHFVIEMVEGSETIGEPTSANNAQAEELTYEEAKKPIHGIGEEKMSKEDLIDLLKSLSRIEGVAMGMKDREASNAITDELIWATDKVVELLKDKK